MLQKPEQALDQTSWALARLGRGIGENSLLQGMDAEVSRISQSELSKVQMGGWQQEESENGFSLERPSGWTVETKQQGRYHRTYLRSGSPYISVMIEVGERDSEGTDSPVDWAGMERDLQYRLGSTYRRVQMSEDTLDGEVAGRWEFEIKCAGEPRLNKMYLGRVHPWRSYVIVCIAPNAENSRWQPIFTHMRHSFSFEDGEQ